MLLQKVDTFEKAINVLLSEEQANADTKQCSGSESQNAEVFAMSAYRRNQNSERSKPNEGKSEYVCQRCLKPGHRQEKCFARDKKCNDCDKIGHYAVACTKNAPRSGSGYTNAIRAQVEEENDEDSDEPGGYLN